MTSMPFKRLAAALFVAATVSVNFAPPLAAAQSERLSMRYDVLVKGMKVFRLRYKVSLSSGSYRSTAKLDPTGFAGLFVKIKMDMDSTGSLGAKSVSARTFKFVRKTKKKKRFNVTWGAGGVATTVRSHALARYKQKTVTKAMRPNLPDPLAALLRNGVIRAANPCSRTERVYNGAEIYDLSFRLLGRQTFGPDDGGVYRGPAYKCRVVYKPVAGLSRKKHAKRTANQPAFTVWFAPVTSRAMGKSILVPVAATGRLKNKPFVAYPTVATLDGKPLNAQSMASR